MGVQRVYIPVPHMGKLRPRVVSKSQGEGTAEEVSGEEVWSPRPSTGCRRRRDGDGGEGDGERRGPALKGHHLWLEKIRPLLLLFKVLPQLLPWQRESGHRAGCGQAAGRRGPQVPLEQRKGPSLQRPLIV